MVSHLVLNEILAALDQAECSVLEFVLSLLKSPGHEHHAQTTNFIHNLDILFVTLLLDSRTTTYTTRWVFRTAAQKHSDSVRYLSSSNGSWHFGAQSATPSQICDFRFSDIATTAQEQAPELWDLLGALLTKEWFRNFDPQTENSSDADGIRVSEGEMQVEGGEDDEDGLWDHIDLGWTEADERALNSVEKAALRAVKKREKRLVLIDIKRVVIVSIMMNSFNVRCNAFQSIIGFFLRACNAPERIVKTLSHFGISISLSSTHRGAYSLSYNAATEIYDMGQTRTIGLAVDNFDMDFPTLRPTVEQSTDTLAHMASGLIFKLTGGVKKLDLRCSDYLWDRCHLNDHAKHLPPRRRTVFDLIAHFRQLHPDPRFQTTGYSRQTRFNAWKFRHDLIHFGPECYRRYKIHLGLPEFVESIPVSKLEYLPVNSMDINVSRVDGVRDALRTMHHQAGISDPQDPDEGIPFFSSTPPSSKSGATTRPVEDVSNYVSLVFGDLGIYKLVLSLQQRRRVEGTVWRRFQHIVFVMGLFHLKMAAADAIWRAFIRPKDARQDKSSLFEFAAQLRPKETGKLASNPGFRRMHEVISDVGACLRLDCWRVEVARREGAHTTLEDFASSNPSWEQITEISLRLASSYVASGKGSNRVYAMRSNISNRERDAQLENTRNLHRYLLFYEELSHSMNAGDIGRLETVWASWIFIFKGTGKHAYSAAMLKFMLDVHFLFPEGLRQAIRYNILINPLGKPMHFRAVDWLVELINLFTKYTYGGSGSNRTKERVLLDSILIELFRLCLKMMERDIHLPGLTYKQGKKDMSKTYTVLLTQLRKLKPNEYLGKRTVTYTTPDVIDTGSRLYSTRSPQDFDENTQADEGDEGGIDLDDLGVETDFL